MENSPVWQMAKMVYCPQTATARPARWCVKVMFTNVQSPFTFSALADSERMRPAVTWLCVFRAEVCRNSYVIVGLTFHMISDTSLALTWPVANKNNAATLGQKDIYMFARFFSVFNKPTDWLLYDFSMTNEIQIVEYSMDSWLMYKYITKAGTWFYLVAIYCTIN